MTPAPEPIRVLLVDDQHLVRQGFRSLLELSDRIVVAGEAADGEEAVAHVLSDRPDVVLLDLRMPRLDGIGTLRALAAKDALPPTLVLTTFDDDAELLQALVAGARGYLLKDVTLERVVAAIETLHAGATFIQPAVTQRLLQSLGQHPLTFERADRPERLTPRETEILRLMAGGYSNKEIAGAVHITEGTAKNQVSAILLKLGVRDRTRAVLRGLELGWVQNPGH